MSQSSMRTDTCAAPVRNYYGGPFVYKQSGKFFLAIEDYSGEPVCEVSQAFYDAFCAEFGGSRAEASVPESSCQGEALHLKNVQALGFLYLPTKDEYLHRHGDERVTYYLMNDRSLFWWHRNGTTTGWSPAAGIEGR